ncbi:MAG: hypothetical protein GXY83_32210 [Rhodopirellula sp.]|nr:hypothetical protein [Rhodopirellula sp.]
MQCPSCQFQNMPGVAVCGQCGSRLQLSGVAIAVHPPRAGRWEKRFHRWLPIGRYHALFDQLRAAVSAATPDLEAEIGRGALLRIVVPGWPQIFAGQTARGRLFFALYLATLLGGLLFAGTPVGGILLGLALATHASSILDVVYRGTHDTPSRIVYSAAFLLLVGIAVYLPVTWAVTRVALPRRILQDVPPFAAGDVVLCNQIAYRSGPADVGDVVLYLPPQLRFQRLERYMAYYQFAGERIDRVLARGGQRVEWRQRRLWVDGVPMPWTPLNPDVLPPQLNLTVPAGSLLILPTTGLPQNFSPTAAEWQQLGVVPAGSVLARVYLRYQPLSRFWIIR